MLKENIIANDNIKPNNGEIEKLKDIYLLQKQKHL